MRAEKHLAKNISIMTISQFGSKILSFLLVPLYTSVLSTEEYGTYDLFNTTVSLLIPILTICISDAALRFPLDEKNDKVGIFTICVRRCIFSQVMVLVPILLNSFFNFSAIIKQYSLYLALMFVTNSISGITINFSRGLDKIKEIGISGVICSVFVLGLNIILLIPLKMGLEGYFIANIVGPIAQVLYLFVSLKLWSYININGKYINLQKNMIAYSAPLIANTTAWWVNNVSDRYVVIWLSGFAANGVYSAAYKIPTILSAIQGIFNQAWTLSAVKEFDANDSTGFFKGIYNLYNCSMVLICSFLIIFTRFTARIMFLKEFYEAWIYVPWLLISVVFGALSGYLGGIFAAVKNTKVFAQTTVISAVVNTVLNIVLVKSIGPLGAAIATLVSYWIIFIMRIKYVKKYINIHFIIIRDYISYFILIFQAILLCAIKNEELYLYIVETLLFAVILIIYSKEFIKIIKMMIGRNKRNEQ